MGKHIVAFSGGKDSTAMLLRMLELNWRIDEIRYFDCGSWEFPEMREHIDLVEKYIGREIRRMRFRYTFDYLLTTIKTQKGGKGYGWPRARYRWCTGRKDMVIQKGIEKKSDVTYIGYASDEIPRIAKSAWLKRKTAFPLVGFGMTGEDCLRYCYERGFRWGGLYLERSRVSCWCCPLQRIDELRNLRRYHPLLWCRLQKMESRTGKNFLGKAGSVSDLELRFSLEDKEKKAKNPSCT